MSVKKLFFALITVTILIISVFYLTIEDEFKVKARKYTLANGLKILMVEDHRAPVAACRIFYNVGSVNEEAGATGISHFLEHMMFKGTKIFGTADFGREQGLLKKEDELMRRMREAETSEDNNSLAVLNQELEGVKKQLEEIQISKDFWIVMKKYGAVGLNAYTNFDVTGYVCSLPSNKLLLWFFIESDRMKNLVLREFYPEIGVVLEEMRMTRENSPSGALDEKFMASIFPGTPYGRPTIGFSRDIKNFTKNAVMDYYKTYYAPNNAIIVLAGDINPTEMISLAEEYFGSIPKSGVGELNPSLFVGIPQKKENRVSMEFPASPRACIGYKTAPANHPDAVVLEIIADLLSSGKTSRLYKKLVEANIADSAIAYSNTLKHTGLFEINFQPASLHTIQEIEDIIYQELENIKNGAISDEELKRVKKQARISFLRTVDLLETLVGELWHCEAILGDWRKINNLIPRIERIAARDVAAAAKKYFTPENRTVAVLNDSRRKEKNYETK